MIGYHQFIIKNNNNNNNNNNDNNKNNKTTSFKGIDKLIIRYEIRILKQENKNRNLLNIEFYREPIYGDNDKYIKTKIKMYEDKVNNIFQS